MAEAAIRYPRLIALILAAMGLAMIASSFSVTPPPEDFQLPEYAWIKEDGAVAESWRQYNDTGPNMLELTYRFSRVNLAYVARSTTTGGDFNVTFIIYHNSSSNSGFNASGHLFTGSAPNWTQTVPAQYTTSGGEYTYHLFITTYDPHGVPGIYQARINETGPGSGSSWSSPGGNPDVQWMFFRVPTAEVEVNMTDQLGGAQPFYLDGPHVTQKLNATVILRPPGNETGSSHASFDWLDTSGATIMTRSSPITYHPSVGWVASDVVPANATAFPVNATHEYAVRARVGYFAGTAFFRMLSTRWANASIQVEPVQGQWFDPSSFKVTFTAVLNTGMPGNPYQIVRNLTLQLWRTSLRGLVANLSWNITGYPVIEGSSYTYTWSGMIPATFIDTNPGGPEEFYGFYTIRSVPSPGSSPALFAELEFYVDDPIESYTSLERASQSARSAFREGSVIWLNIELDPAFLRARQHDNAESVDTSCNVTWDWPTPPPPYIKQEIVQGTRSIQWPSDSHWAFSMLNTSGLPDGFYTIRIGARCLTGYTVWEWKSYDIYQSYTPPTEDPNLPPYTTVNATSSLTWYTHPVTLTFHASDPLSPGATASGVDRIFYQVDGADGGSVAGRVLRIQALEGDHIYTFWSRDRAGNLEIPKSIVVRVDTVPPTTSIDRPTGPGPHPAPVVVRLFGADPDPGSGLESTLYTIDGGQPMACPPDGFLALDGDHTYGYWSIDEAGNMEQANAARLIVVGRPEILVALLAGLLLVAHRRSIDPMRL